MLEVKIISDEKNVLLDRRDVKFTATSDGATPSKDELIKELARQLKADANKIEIDRVLQHFGSHESDCLAKIYNKAIRDSPAEEKAEEPAEASEEKPAEEKEAPAEESKE